VKVLRFQILAVVLALLAPTTARAADIDYTLQSLARITFQPGGLFPPAGNIAVGTLNDRGQIVFQVTNPVQPVPEVLVQFDAGQLTPIARPDQDAPGAKFRKDAWFGVSATMNQDGLVAFTGGTLIGEERVASSFLWDPGTRALTPLVIKGMPASGGKTFSSATGSTPSINNGARSPSSALSPRRMGRIITRSTCARRTAVSPPSPCQISRCRAATRWRSPTSRT
jgi:hypothetical protein